MKPVRITKTTISKEDKEYLDIYMSAIKMYEPLSVDREAELARRIHTGDRAAKDELVNANLRFVVSVAKQYLNRGLDLPDLISEGNIGLIKAAEAFDETLGFKFISYAGWWIRESILQALAKDGRTIRLPKDQVKLIGRINKTISEFENKHGRTPTDSEIAEILDVVDDDVITAINASARIESLDAQQSEDDDRNYLETHEVPGTESADAKLNAEAARSELRSLLLDLNPEEQYIIGHSLGFGYEQMTLIELSEDLGKDTSIIRRIRNKARRHLEQRTKSEELRNWLQNFRWKDR